MGHQWFLFVDLFVVGERTNRRILFTISLYGAVGAFIRDQYALTVAAAVPPSRARARIARAPLGTISRSEVAWM